MINEWRGNDGEWWWRTWRWVELNLFEESSVWIYDWKTRWAQWRIKDTPAEMAGAVTIPSSSETGDGGRVGVEVGEARVCPELDLNEGRSRRPPWDLIIVGALSRPSVVGACNTPYLS